MIRVVIADDHGLVREGLRRLVDAPADIGVVGTAASGREAVELIERTRPDVALMDLSMPDIDGIAATRQALARAPDTHVVILTSFSDRERILEALDAGAIGYLLKDAEPDELLRGIRTAVKGDSPLAPRAAAELIADRRPAGSDVRNRSAEPEQTFTPREREILALLAQGRPNKVIARRLDIAEQTVKNHLSHIFQTLGVTDRTQAALWAQRNGVVEP
ncbi:MAG TPA: response regulator transcription factor [Baekduia sp.]|nr:response regulator transcription factor [Baekduia sp.]